MIEFLDTLERISAPLAAALGLIASAWVLATHIAKKDAKKQPALGENVVAELIASLKEAQRREDECSREIAILKRDRDRDLVRIQALEAAVAQKSAQIDALFAIIHGGRDQTVLSNEFTRIRAWMVRHLSEEDLIVIASDVGLNPPQSNSPELQCKDLIDDAERKGLMNRLLAEIRAKRPNVAHW